MLKKSNWASQEQFWLSVILILGLSILFGLSLFIQPFKFESQANSGQVLPATVSQQSSSLSKIEVENPKSVLDKNQLVSVMLTGDIMLSRWVNREIRLHHNYNYPFLKTESFLQQADVAVANLECPISPGRIIRDREMIFRADPASAKSLAEAGFDLVSLANNHTGNWGQQGINSTIQYLQSAGVKYVGAGPDYQSAYQSVIIEKKGIKIGFLAYVDPSLIPTSYLAIAHNPGVASMDDPADFQRISKLKKQVDFLIVSMHCGQEYQREPSQKEVNFAHQAIEAGADLVFNSHPHIIQSVEKYHQGYIFYSLGNFVFDQMWSEETREGIVAELMLNKSGVVELNFYPFIIQHYAQPNFVFGSDGKKILAHLKLPLEEKLIIKDNQPIVFGGYFLNQQKVSFRSMSINKIGQDKQAKIQDYRAVVDFSNHQLFWESPRQWKVENILLGDVNNDNEPELVLTLWKYGRYGSDLPFWQKQNINEWGNHLFLYQIEGDFIRQIWGSSTIKNPINEIALLKTTSGNKLVVLAYDGLSFWQWDEWNFYQDKFWPIKNPSFLRIISLNSNFLPLVDTQFIN